MFSLLDLLNNFQSFREGYTVAELTVGNNSVESSDYQHTSGVVYPPKNTEVRNFTIISLQFGTEHIW